MTAATPGSYDLRDGCGGASLGGQESGSIGVGFAIPIDHAKQIVDQLTSQG
ncbi:MAG: hypothetical protein ACXV0U_03750 [Kineosporiaceae bacterium]